MKPITIAIVTAFALPLSAACEEPDATDHKAEEAAEMAEELQEERLREDDVYGPIDREISGEITDERFELVVETQEENRARAQETQDSQAEGKLE